MDRRHPRQGKAAAIASRREFISRGGLIAAGATAAITGCSPPARQIPGAVVQRNVPVPMRDGVILRADIRLPVGPGPFPVLIFRTPYGKYERDPYNERTFAHAVSRGFAMVIQDVRGRYASNGDFTPYQNEGQDGYDTIEWAARQPWSDGRVGTFGLSYPGAVQWLAAVENPPHLKAMVPAMCFSTIGSRFIYFGGVFESAWASWTYLDMSANARLHARLPGPRTLAAAKAEWDKLGGDKAIEGWLPSLDMPFLKDSAPYYYAWLEHSPYDPWWNWGDLRDKYHGVSAAVLNLSGWYDEPYGTEGAITNYQGLVASRSGQADPRTKLLIGPWIHGVDATGQAASGHRRFADAARIDYDQVVLDWLDHYVRGIRNGVRDWPDVKVYVMGDETWRHATTWPLPGTARRRAYLGPPRAFGGFGSITFRQPSQNGAEGFVSDPASPVTDDFGTNFGAFDLRALAGRPDVLTFETTPLAQDLRVVGQITARIYARTGLPDFDLYCKLLDVAPDGTSFNLESAGHEVLRASYRERTVTRQLLAPGQIVALDFDNLITGNTFRKGHKLRVCLTASWFPTYSRNLQTGEPETVSTRTRKGLIEILYGPASPSQLLFPII